MDITWPFFLPMMALIASSSSSAFALILYRALLERILRIRLVCVPQR
jgi:hypothetical protein